MTTPRRREVGPLRWEGVELRPYKPDGQDTFRHLSRQVLFDRDDLACQVRVFVVEPGGHTTLERHQHSHAVMVLEGRGQCLVGDQIVELRPHDLVEVGPWQWHQFRAATDDHLGFVCIVNQDRDRPQVPTAADLEAMTADREICAFVDPDLHG